MQTGWCVTPLVDHIKTACAAGRTEALVTRRGGDPLLNKQGGRKTASGGLSDQSRS